MKNNKTNNTQNVELLYSSDPDMRFDLGGKKAFATFFTDRVRSVYREGEIFDPSGIRIQVDEEDESTLIYATLENVDLKRQLTTADTQVVVSYGKAQIIVPILVIPADCRRSVPAQKNVTLNSRTVATWYPAIGLSSLTFAGLKFDKSLLGFGITHTYCPLSLNCGWGYGWKSNIDVKLAKAATLGVSNAAEEDCVYEAENGFRYLFAKRYYYFNSVGSKTIVNASDVVIVNEKPTYDGVELQKEYYCELGLIAKDSDKSNYALVMENGNVDYYFDRNGNLAYIQDKYGNYIKFTWKKVSLPSNTSVWVINSATESVPKGDGKYDEVSVTFTRDTDGNITNVVYDSSSSNSKTFTYRYDDGFLSHIEFSDGFKVYMSYKNGLLGALTWHADGVRTEFSYTGNKLTQLKLMSRLGEISKDSTLQTDYKTVSVLNFGLLTATSMPYMSKDNQKQAVFVDCDDCDAGGYTQLMEKQVLSAPLTFNYTDIDGRWGFTAFEEEVARPLSVSANAVKATKTQGSAEAAVLLATVSGSQIPKGRKELVVSAQAKLRGQVNSSDIRRFTLPYKTVGTDEDFVYGIKAVVNFADNTEQTYYASFNSTVARLQPVALPLSFKKQVSDVNVYGVSKLPNATATFRNVRIAAGNWEYKEYDQFGRLKNAARKNVLTGFDEQDVACYRNSENYVTYDENGKVLTNRTVVSMWKNDTKFDEKSYMESTTYTSKGDPSQVKNFVEQEILSRGQNVTQYEYNSNGVLLSKYSYNTTVPSKKFYEIKRECDEYGRVTRESNEFGDTLKRYYYKDDDSFTSNPSKVIFTNRGCNQYEYNDQGEITLLKKLPNLSSSNALSKIEFGYNFGKLTSVSNDSDNVFYTYNEEEEICKVTLNDETTQYIKTKNVERYGRDCDCVTKVLPTGDRESVYSAKDGKYTEAILNGVTISKQTYDDAGNIVRFEDERAGRVTDYEYDEQNSIKTVSSVVIGEDSEIVSEQYEYNEYGDIKSKAITVNGKTDHYSYAYNNNSVRGLRSVQVNDVVVNCYEDIYGRNLGKVTTQVNQTNGGSVAETITYAERGNYSSSKPAQVKLLNATKPIQLDYAYDVNGNITTVSENGKLICSYTYDEFNRLNKEINYKFNESYLFSYDECGNILSKKVTSLLDANSVQMFACVYDKKKLASYNGESCAFGNNNKLVRWRNKTVEWFGRKLTKLGTTTFSYDGFGNRIAKNGILFTYDSQGNLIEQSNGLRFMYDHTGVMGFEYEGNTYVYQKDILGNIVAIVDSNGEIVASYVYDAWGNHKIYDSIGSEYSRPTFIGNLNPFRYRGYYYDSETGLYYLNSRYYDPEVCRFISADAVKYVEPSIFGGLNLYAYCNNNPVMYSDAEGTSFWDDLVKKICDNYIILEALAIAAAIIVTAATWGAGTPAAAMIIGATIGGGIGALNAVAHKEDVLIGTLTGAFVGFLGASSWIAAGLAAFGTTFTRCRVNGVQVTPKVICNAIVNGVTASAYAYGSTLMYDYILGIVPYMPKTLYTITYPIEEVVAGSIASSGVFSFANWAMDLIVEFLLK